MTQEKSHLLNSHYNNADPESPRTPGGSKPLLVRLEEAMHVRRAIKAIHALPVATLCLIGVFILLVISGGTGQLLALNIWLTHFPKNLPLPFTVLTVSATTIATGFLVSLLIRIAIYRPSLRFALTKKGIILTILVGFCNSLNGVLLVFGTHDTPEVLQALLLSTQIFWTLLFSKLMLHDSRSFLNVAVVTAFLLCAGGIICGAVPEFTSPHVTGKQKQWTTIFAVSMIPGALYNVFAMMYMKAFTHPDSTLMSPTSTGTKQRVDVDDDRNRDGSISTPLARDETAEGLGDSGYGLNKTTYDDADGCYSDDTTVKLTMLTTTGFSQVFWMFVLFPMDSVHGFGPSKTLAESRHNLHLGWSCVFGSGEGCSQTWIYFVVFNISYMSNYFGGAYLNHYSATLASMVAQLSSPIAAMILIIFPTLNVTQEHTSTGWAAAAIAMLIVGSFVYSSWEQGSREQEEKARSQRNFDDAAEEAVI